MTPRGKVLLALGVAAAAAGGVGFYLWRRSSGGSNDGVAPAADVEPQPEAADTMSTFAAKHDGQVFHLERADQVDARLRAALADYAANGPIPIVITDGLRVGAAAAAAQLGYFNNGQSKAKTLQETPHGRGGAVDFQPVRESNGDGVISTWTKDDNPDAYQQVGLWFEARGFTWGGRWTTAFRGGDVYHLEVPDWTSLPFPPTGANA